MLSLLLWLLPRLLFLLFFFFLLLFLLLLASPAAPVFSDGKPEPEPFLPREGPVVGEVRGEVQRGRVAASRGRGVVAVAAFVGFIAGFGFIGVVLLVVEEQPALQQHPSHALPEHLSRGRSSRLFVEERAWLLPPGRAEEAGRRRRQRRR